MATRSGSPVLPRVEVVPVAYGLAAAEALHRCVAAAKEGDPLAPVTIVVPSNYVGVAARRRLASGGLGALTGSGVGVAGVVVLTPYRLAELLGAARLAAAGRRPVSTPVVAAALRGVLARDPGVFAGVADHPATEEALVGAYRELAGVGDAARAAVSACNDRTRDVVRICEAARADLRSAWYDEADLVDAALAALPGSPVARELGTVVLHLPQETAPPLTRLLAAVAAARPVVVVAGRTGVDAADADVRRLLTGIGADAAGFDAFDAHHDTSSPEVAAADMEVISASDADDEVRSVVRRIVDAARAGIALERMAVLYGTDEPYARLLHEHLSAAGLAFNGAAVRPVSERVAGRFLLDTLALPEDGYRRRDVMALVAGAPVRDGAGRHVPATQWQRLSREAAVVGGDDWDRRLDRYASSRAAEAGDARADEQDARAERLERDAEAARRLREFVASLRVRLEGGAGAQTWAERAVWARALLVDHLGPEHERRTWPEHERRAAEKVEAALDRLGGLDDVAPGATLAEFGRTLELELDSDLGRVGRLGEGVLVGRVGTGIGQDLDLVCIVGLAEGLLPARIAEDTLLSDSERAAAGGELRMRTGRSDVEHRQVLAALAAARRHRVLSFPRGDLRASSERIPSRWLLDAVEARTGVRVWSEDFAALREPWVRQVPSFASGVTTVAFPATTQEYRLRAMRADATCPGDPVLERAAEMLRARRSDAFTRFDGNLAGHGPILATDRAVSATAFQNYVTCPHAYLLETVLRVATVEDPGEVLRMSPLEYGNLVHEILERFVTDGMGSGDAGRSDRDRLLAIADSVAAEYEARGVTGRPLFWHADRRRLESDLLGFLDSDAARRAATGAAPIAAELPFGLDGADPVEIEVAGGRTVAFRGRADRVDACGDGRLVVYDYKTGKANGYSGLSETNPDACGTRLQLPLYGLAARARAGRPDARVKAEYWFVTGRGRFATKGYDVTDAVLERFREVIGTIVAGIDAGMFPARAHEQSYSGFPTCIYCDPDQLGTLDTNIAWERKKTAAALGSLLALVEAEADADA
ncbi:MAG: PD-(D/E)XK nuclease family protein [Acidimicrobiia bacterium]